MNFSKRVRDLRSEAGYTQAKLGELVGVSTSTIRKYETNKGKPKTKNLEKIAAVFNVSVSYLLGETDTRTPSNLDKIDILSQRLKKLRIESGYTQKEIAQKLGITGSGYSKYGNGTEINLPRTERLLKLAEIFNVSVSFLLGETDDRPFHEVVEPNSFQERLKLLRTEGRYTQKDLVKKLKLSSTQVYSNYERGVRHPSKETLESIAELFNVSVEYLLCENDERTTENH
ncbi:helix-turn-helix transcriptional regulator [Lactococcus lactis]|uniref:helix-turn-helix domain-containing protein n=1 Tax=Lactococcus lactis TaxID=1358 RepID=UPI001913F14C|nr:helix-turn-helix transcriptional regulator [Lactococcus lactis]MBK5077276.1 helix-turn-helix transcriptional regulator [Lactococcus lactis]WDA67400.1 helix-turn-helix transcriptional regulator [Lactococcus lactis]